MKGYKKVKRMTLKQVEKYYPKVAEQMKLRGENALEWLKDSSKKLFIVFKKKGKQKEPYTPTPLAGLGRVEQRDLFSPRHEVKMYRGKITDVGEPAPGNLVKEYWDDHIENAHWQDGQGRTGKAVPSSFKYYDQNFIWKAFKLRFIEFGNWLNQQDRLDYTAGLGLGLYDLASVLKITKAKLSIKGKLGIALGARGIAKTIAHFEANNFYININRHPDIDKKGKAYYKSGAGALAHEYGHAIDYFVGGKSIKGKETIALSTETNLTEFDIFLDKKSPLQMMQNLLYKIKYGEIPTLVKYNKLSPEAKERADKMLERAAKKNELSKNRTIYLFPVDTEYKRKDSSYYKRLKGKSFTGYYRKPQEIFARAFESYVWHLMAEKGITNSFLQRKRTGSAYLKSNEFAAVLPEMKQLITAMKKYL